MHLPVMKPFYMLLLFAASLLTSEGASMKIVNGHEAPANSRPYMALIVFENTSHISICGGSLIKPNWVLTAAHCQASGGKTKVILGAHLSDEKLEKNGRQKFDVDQYMNHPKYDSTTLNNDIQLMKLSGNARLGDKVKLLSLPKTYKDVEAQTICKIAGWGKTEKNNPASVLMQAKVKAISRELCSERINMNKTDVGKMCTSTGPEGQNACSGDSGGPLICDGVFRGIVSYGSNPCNERNGVTVYTRLTKACVKWINNNTGP